MASDQDQAPTAGTLTPPAQPSLAAAWCYLVVLSLQRQARARQMVWIALGLVGCTALILALFNLAGGGWGMKRWRWPIPTARPENIPPRPD